MRGLKPAVKAKQKQAMPSKAAPTMTDFVKKQTAMAQAKQKQVMPSKLSAPAPTPKKPASTQSSKGTFPGQATPEAKQALLRSQPQVAPTPIRKPTAAEQKTYNDFLAAQKREAEFSKIKARPPGMAKGGMAKKKPAPKKK
jgi:hypothetical protein